MLSRNSLPPKMPRAPQIDGFIPAQLRRFTPDAPLMLASGVELVAPTVGYQSWGKLNATGDNAVWVCHALTGTTDVESWWPALFGAGKALDPTRDFIVCANVLGGCYGSAGPHTHGADFPEITISDMVRHQHALALYLGVKKIKLMLGGSMGGFQALEWALQFPGIVQRLALISTSYRQPAQAIALSSLQCAQIERDPKFLNGRYAPENGPIDGLNLARQIGHLSYRCGAELDARFDRAQDESGEFEVNRYLAHQGNKLVRRFDANSYLRLNRAMNAFDACAGRGEPRFALGRLNIPALVVAVDSDWLYPPSEQARLAALLPHAAHISIHSNAGHDGFLLDAALFEPALRALLHGDAHQANMRVAQG
jgi:homoserine O-acetyltransferase/O-succinyltransferase